jgi:hypothetical protein
MQNYDPGSDFSLGERDPSNWSTSALRDWLNDADLLDAPRAELEAAATRRLDHLYAKFSPSYPNTPDSIDVSRLMPWESLLHRVPGMFGAPHSTPLQHAFKESFSMEEVMALAAQARGQAPLMGRHPLDDLRMNLMSIGCWHDRGEVDAMMFQDGRRMEGLTLVVLRVLFLPPGKKLRPGDSVVCHNLQGVQEESLQQLGGRTARVTATNLTAGTCTLAFDEEGDDVPGQEAHTVVRGGAPSIPYAVCSAAAVPQQDTHSWLGE